MNKDIVLTRVIASLRTKEMQRKVMIASVISSLAALAFFLYGISQGETIGTGIAYGLIAGGLTSCYVVCWMKEKYVFFALGLMGAFLFPVIGALRPAKKKDKVRTS